MDIHYKLPVNQFIKKELAGKEDLIFNTEPEGYDNFVTYGSQTDHITFIKQVVLDFMDIHEQSEEEELWLKLHDLIETELSVLQKKKKRKRS